MKYAEKIIKAVLVIFFGVLIVVYSAEVSVSVVNSINICINVIVPSMFIFMVICSYILSSGLYRTIFSPVYHILKRILRLDEELISVFMLSLIGGYPIGIKLSNELISQNKNYHAIADKTAAFCYCISPTFAVTMLGIELYRSIEVGIVIYLANVISCFITATAYSRFFTLRLPEKNIVQESKSGIIDAINSSASTLLRICAIIVFFNSGITVIECSLNQIGIALPEFIKSILEISNILKTEAITLSSLPFVSSLASFGGICVIVQCVSLIKGAYSIKHFVISRFFNALISYFVTKFMLFFWDISLPVFSTCRNMNFNFSPHKAATVFLMIMIIILMQKSEKNFKKG